MTCVVHRHRDYVPIERHHRWPLYLGGPDTRANIVPLCANGHSAVHEYLRLLARGGGKVSWYRAMRYGPKVRALAKLGYDEWQASLR